MAPQVPAPYLLNAVVLDVHDGDTISVEVSWGKRRYDDKQPIRILGIAARELADPGGPEARDYLKTLLPIGSRVVLGTVKDDRYPPRWDAQVTYLCNGVIHDLATDLITDGWAASWDGRGTQPKPAWPRTTT